MAHRSGQRRGRTATEPDRRVRSLHRFGRDGQVVDVAEPAVEFHPRPVGPRRFHQGQALGEISDMGGHVDAESRESAGTATGRNTEIEAAVAEPVDGGHRRGQLQRIMQRGHQNTDPQP